MSRTLKHPKLAMSIIILVISTLIFLITFFGGMHLFGVSIDYRLLLSLSSTAACMLLGVGMIHWAPDTEKTDHATTELKLFVRNTVLGALGSLWYAGMLVQIGTSVGLNSTVLSTYAQIALIMAGFTFIQREKPLVGNQKFNLARMLLMLSSLGLIFLYSTAWTLSTILESSVKWLAILTFPIFAAAPFAFMTGIFLLVIISIDVWIEGRGN